jgi:hypothetical protein
MPEKRKVHITWEDAWKAEAERERARQAVCRPLVKRSLLEIFAGALKELAASFKSRLIHAEPPKRPSRSGSLAR